MTSEIGARIREARLAQGLGLRSTASAASISPSLLSQVETGKVQPSVSTLYAVVGALGISIDAVLGDRPVAGPPRRGDHDNPVQRRAAAPEIVMENGVTWRRLAVTDAAPVDALLVTYEPGGSSSLDETHMRHPGVEYGYIVRGELTLKLDFDTYTLFPGDSVCFDSMRPHLYVNHTDGITEGVWFVRGEPASGAPESDPPAVIRSAVDVLEAMSRLHSRANG